MAKSRFEYVKSYELPDILLPGTYIIARVDGRGFHKFSDAHSFEKPNDRRALNLMNHAAGCVMEDLKDVICAFGESDEYSFLIRKSSKLYNRRRSKINSTIVSIFTASYVFYWPKFFPNTPLQSPPSFDGRVVLYPSAREIRDYFAWRQADTHINNLYNTAFWALIQHGGLSTTEANKALQGTDSKDKNEILYSRFNINYNNLDSIFRKGTILVRRPIEPPQELTIPNESSGVNAKPVDETRPQVKPKRQEQYEGVTGELDILHEDIIKDGFWNARPWLLAT
ncbi:Thg1 C terminal domain-domain-containing protein [Kockovaella imperatae]|uniref:tRNA(His) guanylyltransferase n=1 Tax=Kockovaella imperatae TaxID=4999 RepID=A0A1Y1USH6_9TREE|nr:Thg1 C terminal domain-domain-containing protein [Kockovaella imperatae]ORX40949.1 Thg1 C terminal domain-domain-containing protein [Kockovaella imperatae]